MYILASETSRSRATQLRSPRDRLVASLAYSLHDVSKDPFPEVFIRANKIEQTLQQLVKRKRHLYRDYFMVGECVRFLFTSCEGSLNERVSAANE